MGELGKGSAGGGGNLGAWEWTPDLASSGASESQNYLHINEFSERCKHLLQSLQVTIYLTPSHSHSCGSQSECHSITWRACDNPRLEQQACLSDRDRSLLGEDHLRDPRAPAKLLWVLKRGAYPKF
jgi:hypothetical protein